MLLARKGNNLVCVWVGANASCLKRSQQRLPPSAPPHIPPLRCFDHSLQFWSQTSWTSVNLFINRQLEGGAHTYTHKHSLSCTHAHMRTRTQTLSLTCACTHTHTHVHLSTYTHTNTRTNRQAEWLSGDPQTSIQLVSLGWWPQVSWSTLGDDNSQDVIFETGYNSRLFRNSVRSWTNPSPSVISFRKSSVSPTVVDGELSAISWSSDARPLLSTSMGCSLEPSTWKSGHNNNKRYFGHPLLEELIFLAPHLGWVW